MLAITSASAEKVSLHYYQKPVIFDIFINCNRVVTRWQYTFTHKKCNVWWSTLRLINLDDIGKALLQRRCCR